jgi:cysteine desulfurase family protein (TIGR01976 family)
MNPRQAMVERAVFDVEYARSFFEPLKNGWAFFENAGGVYVPRQVVDRMSAYMNECQVQIGGDFAPSADATSRVRAGVAAAAGIIGASATDVVVGPSTTLNARVLANALGQNFQDGDEIIIAIQNHEANIGAWTQLERDGIKPIWWRVDPETGDLDTAQLGRLISNRTKLICAPHCSNLVGSINDIKQISAIAHEAGALACIDGVAYAPHRFVDVTQTGVDFYLFSTYKTFGPHLGALYGRPSVLAQLPNQNHYFLDDSSTTNRMNPGGMAHESVASIVGVGDYIATLNAHHNLQAGDLTTLYALIANHEQKLAARFLDYLLSVKGVRLLGAGVADQNARLPIFSFVFEGRSSREIATQAASEKVAIRSGGFYANRLLDAMGIDADDGVIRASMIHYNSQQDVDRLIAALDRALADD